MKNKTISKYIFKNIFSKKQKNLNYNNVLIKMFARGEIIPLVFLEEKIKNIKENIIEENYIKKDFEKRLNYKKRDKSFVLLTILYFLIGSLIYFLINYF